METPTTPKRPIIHDLLIKLHDMDNNLFIKYPYAEMWIMDAFQEAADSWYKRGFDFGYNKAKEEIAELVKTSLTEALIKAHEESYKQGFIDGCNTALTTK